MWLRSWWETKGFRSIERSIDIFSNQLDCAGIGHLRAVKASVRRFAEQSLRGVSRSKKGIADEFQTLWRAWFLTPSPDGPRQDFYQTAIAKSSLVGALAFVVLEGFLAAAVSVLYVRASIWFAVVIGVGMTVRIAYAVKGILVPIFLGPWRDMPQGGFKPLLRWLGVTFPLEMLLIGFVVFTRSVALEWTATAFDVTVALLTLWTPLVAGIMLSIFTLLRWSNELTERYGRNLMAWNKSSMKSRSVRSRG